MAFFGTWAVVGLYLDGWAHQTNKPESFFTPWHLVLYSAVGTAIAWFTIDGWRRGRAGSTGPDDRIGGVGLVVFGIGAVGDFGWHSIFGVEESLEALLSPTHLALMIGGVMMLSVGLRTSWARPDDGRPSLRTLWPAVASMTLATAIVSFFFMYLSAFQFGGLAQAEGWQGAVFQTHGIASVLVTNLIMLGPTLLLAKRWRPPFGAFTLMYTVLAYLMVGMTSEFGNLPVVATGVVGGLVADGLGQRLDPARSRLFATGVPLVMWSTWFATLQSIGGVEWPAELIAGTVILATMSGWVLSVLMSPMPLPEHQAA